MIDGIIIRSRFAFVVRGGPAMTVPTVDQRTVVANQSRFERFKNRHQNPTIAIPVAIVRALAPSPHILRYYTWLRVAVADWRSGVLPEYASPKWIERQLHMGKRKRLACERELERLGLFRTKQNMVLRRIGGRSRLVKGQRTAQIFAELGSAQKASVYTGVYSGAVLSGLKTAPPNASSEKKATALRLGEVKTKNQESLPLDRVTQRAPDREPTGQKPVPDSFGPHLTEEQNNLKPAVQARPEAKTRYRPDLTLRSVLEIKEKFFVSFEDIEAWQSLEAGWQAAGGPVDRKLLIDFLENAITGKMKSGSPYNSITLRRLKELRRRDFSPRISAAASSVSKWAAPAGTCPRCGDTGLAVALGGTSGSFCVCAAGTRLMFPRVEVVLEERKNRPSRIVIDHPADP